MRLPFVLLAFLAACRVEPEIEDAVVRLAATPGAPAAGYFTLKPGAEPLTLTGVSSPAARRIEMHRTMRVMRGMTGMEPILEITSADELRFEPGGKHLMLYGMDRALRPGNRIPLAFRLADGQTLRAEAKIIAPGADPAA